MSRDNIPCRVFAVRHPSHQHQLYVSINRDGDIECSNTECGREIDRCEVFYSCTSQECDFDLCSRCVCTPYEGPPVPFEPLDVDDKIRVAVTNSVVIARQQMPDLVTFIPDVVTYPCLVRENNPDDAGLRQ